MVTPIQQLADLKGLNISDHAAIVDRIGTALERIEAALVRHAAETVRLQRIEAAAAAALADLDAMIGDVQDGPATVAADNNFALVKKAS